MKLTLGSITIDLDAELKIRIDGYITVFSGLTTVAVLITLFRSFRFATKDDIDRLERQFENMNQRIDRHFEGHQ